METAAGEKCQGCDRPRREGERLCPLCGELFGLMAAEPRPAPARATVRATAPPAPTAFPAPPNEEVGGAGRGWFMASGAIRYLAIGAICAPIFGLTPVLQIMGWFLSALTHEMGHSVVGWFFGVPSFPAIRLDGHAVAVSTDQKVWMASMVMGLLVFGATRLSDRRLRNTCIGVVAVAYPLLAFTPIHELFILLGGHGGELAFACIAFWRAITGGFTSSNGERALYATVAWFLVADNLVLSLGLVFSAAARAHYATNGSFGLTNDYLRVANDVLGMPLPLVAFGMTLLALGTLPLAFGIARWTASR